MSEQLTDTRLKALLSSGITSSRAYDNSEFAGKRQRELEYYQGKMTDTPAKKGRSSVVSTDVADTIGWMLPGIMRVFTASDRMAECEPVQINDDAFAGQATDAINYVFWKDNDGYRILYGATFDSLLHGNGIVKHWWDDAEECEYSTHSGLDEMSMTELVESDGVEVLAASQDDQGFFDIKIKRVTSTGRVALEVIAQEDFLIDDKAITIDDARFVAQREETTRSDLIKRGFDKAKVDAIPLGDDTHDTLDDIARQDDETLDDAFNEKSMEKIDIYECYIRVDADGDGVAETVRAYYAGETGSGELLDWEIWDDDLPFSDIPCSPVPHRWAARSVSDDTIEPQRIKTVLTRQALDNLYASNIPMREVEEGSVLNMDALLNPQFGGVVIRKKGSAPSQPLEVPLVAGDAFNAIQYVDDMIEKRTGVSRSTMALDPQALTNQTATASQNQRDSAYSQIELVARNQAELGWRRVFRQILRLMVKHQDQERMIRLRDEWVEIDPRHWNASMDVTINVGLGTGSRDRDMAMLNQILQQQVMITDRLAQSGFPDIAIDMAGRLQKTLIKFTESAGMKNPETYFPAISEEMLAGAKQRIEEMKSKPNPEMEKERAKMEAENQRAQMQMQLEQQKNEAEIALKREQLAAEMDLKREQLAAELALKRELAMMGVSQPVGSSSVHLGGEAG